MVAHKYNTPLICIAALWRCFSFSAEQCSSVLSICLLCWAFYSLSCGFSTLPSILLLCRVLYLLWRYFLCYSVYIFAEKKYYSAERKLLSTDEKCSAKQKNAWQREEKRSAKQQNTWQRRKTLSREGKCFAKKKSAHQGRINISAEQQCAYKRNMVLVGHRKLQPLRAIRGTWYLWATVSYNLSVL